VLWTLQAKYDIIYMLSYRLKSVISEELCISARCLNLVYDIDAGDAFPILHGWKCYSQCNDCGWSGFHSASHCIGIHLNPGALLPGGAAKGRDR